MSAEDALTGQAARPGFGGRADYLRLGSTGISLALVALAGVVVSALLARRFGAAAVGQFNQLAAVQIVGSQLAAFGIHLSCMHHLSARAPASSEWKDGARAALLLSAGTGAAVGLALLALAGVLEALFDSPGLAHGLRWVALATPLFAVNKVLLALLNVADRIHALALAQVARPLAWIVAAIALGTLGRADAAALGLLLLAGEGACLFCAAGLLAGALAGAGTRGAGAGWLRRHLSFGWRALPSHLIVDLNTRVDVLVLGVFASDAVVGTYSVAALLAEGVFQLGVLVRTVITRRLAIALAGRDAAALATLRAGAGRLSLLATLCCALAAAVAFRPAIELLGLDPTLAQGWTALLVLLAGVAAAALYSPFWMALVLAGRPAAHTWVMAGLLAVNLGLALVLVPAFGMLGAAGATAAMLAVFPWLLRAGVRRQLGVTL